MDIKTKFDIGDDVWVLHKGKPKKVKIKKIWITIGGKTHISYGYHTTKDYGCLDTVDECECFATKDELMKYIYRVYE